MMPYSVTLSALTSRHIAGGRRRVAEMTLKGFDRALELGSCNLINSHPNLNIRFRRRIFRSKQQHNRARANGAIGVD